MAYIYYKLMAHMIMEAEKFHQLLSASWKPRKAGGIFGRPEGRRDKGQISI